MSIIQFFRIIWARRFVILMAPLVAFLVALAVVQIVPPKYKAESRIMLDVIKPDPVTGEIMSSPFLRAYTRTQTEMIKDLKVATRVVADLQMANDPKLQALYRGRGKNDDRDFAKWAAQRVSDNADAELIEGSNIIDISYKADNADTAKRVCDAIRTAYIQISLEDRREAARRNADWYDQQAARTKAVLEGAEAEKSNYERQNGVLLQDDRVDIDSARLAALASQGGAPVFAQAQEGASALALQLAQLEASIAQASSVLGPNHPDLIDMRRKREVMIKQVNQERATMNASAGAAVAAQRATAGMLEAQKSKVMGQREKVERLRLLQDNVNLQRDQYTKAAARSAELRQEAEVAATPITTLGTAVTPQTPAFPNKPLILFGSVGLGGGVGVVVALLLEILVRRIRSAEDLRSAVGAPVLTVLPGLPSKKRKARRDRRRTPFATQPAGNAAGLK